MYRIRRFGVLRTATTVALMYGVAIAVLLTLFLVIALAVGTSPGTGGGAGGFGGATGGLGPLGGIVIGVLAGLFYFVLVWIFTAIACLFYNLAARFVGGIQVAVDRVEPAAAPPLPATWGGAPQQGVSDPRLIAQMRANELESKARQAEEVGDATGAQALREDAERLRRDAEQLR